VQLLIRRPISSILVIGAKNSGKTSFIEFLRTALAPPSRRKTRTEDVDPNYSPPNSAGGYTSSAFTSHYLETEIDSERVGLTLWDSQGLEKNLVDLQLKEMISFLESKFEDTFTEEMKVIRSPGVRDTHIHCVFLLLDPVRLEQTSANAKSKLSQDSSSANFPLGPKVLVGGLDEDLDLNVIRSLQGKTTVFPVISKADTITSAHMKHLKKTVAQSLRESNLDPIEALGLEDMNADDHNGRESRIDEQDEEEAEAEAAYAAGSPNKSHALSSEGREDDEHDGIRSFSSDDELQEMPVRRLSHRKHASYSSERGAEDEGPANAYLPLSIISPDMYDPETIGRKFPWGMADPYHADHCDFLRLKDAVFSEWRGELREASREVWYEGWRTSRLRRRDK
jgi:septin family protein